MSSHLYIYINLLVELVLCDKKNGDSESYTLKLRPFVFINKMFSSVFFTKKY